MSELLQIRKVQYDKTGIRVENPCPGTSSQMLAIHSQIGENTLKKLCEVSGWIRPFASSVLEPKTSV